jgi:replicative superfamily II helicase
MEIVLGPPAPKTVKGITKATVESSVERGSVLVLCGGPDSAMTRASELAEDMPDVDVDQYMTAVIHYLDAEIGRPSLLTQCLRRGVAYHHSGLSQEARWLVEGLIRRGSVRIVCGTTTLAQGVNFPITTVVVESLRKGRDSELSYADFWNIAGRAGRALVDTVGLIAFPAPDAEKRRQYEAFLRGEAQEISSQLARLIDRADEIEDNFSLSTIERWPELSSLLQFLAHAMKVSGKNQVAEDVEDLLRASLVYHQARRDSEERAQRLVDLCRSYLLHIEDRTDILPLADQTGFATPSVLSLLSRRSSLPELTYRQNWKPDNLFGENLSTLTLCIQSISGLPEIQLSEGRGRPFDPQRVAAILRDWVQGATLEQLTNNYSLEDPDTATDKRIAHFTRYLFSTLLGQASWGLGALETVYLGDTRDAATSSANEEGYVPSMVFFGVHQPEAVWMRMVGVPRVVANGVAALWRQSQPSEPESFQELRGWVDQLTDAAWTQAIPTDSQLTASDMKLLWHDFVGARADLSA